MFRGCSGDVPGMFRGFFAVNTENLTFQKNMAAIQKGDTPNGPIQNRILTIYGKPGTGKTFISVLFASVHKRIYSNVIIKHHGKIVSNTIQNIDDIEKIQFSNIKGIVILDEGGINVNARRSSSEQNMEFGKLGML